MFMPEGPTEPAFWFSVEIKLAFYWPTGVVTCAKLPCVALFVVELIWKEFVPEACCLKLNWAATFSIELTGLLI